MYGIGSEPSRDRIRPDHLRLDRQQNAFVAQAPQRVLGDHQLAHTSGRIFERGLHAVPAVEHGRTVCRLEPSALGASAETARVAPRMLPGFASPCAGSSHALAEFATRGARIDLRASASHKAAARPAGNRFRLAVRPGGRVSRAAKGADCKSAGYAFVGSSPTSPTRHLRTMQLLAVSRFRVSTVTE